MVQFIYFRIFLYFIPTEMLFSKETLKAYADSKGITNVDESVYQLLSQDLEYRVKELCQEASKFMYASHRSKLTIDDINYALISRNIDPLFGYDPTESLSFKKLQNFYYIPDEEIDLEDFLNKPLPKVPLKPLIQSHWLAIEGIQPQIPENINIEDKKDVVYETLHHYVEDAEIKATNKHVLTKELQAYFDKINSFINGDEMEHKMALECLENDSGIQQLIPYFIHLFYETMIGKKERDEIAGVNACIQMLFAILRNSFIFIDPYLHQVIPALLTGILGKDLDDDTRKISCEAIKYLYDRYSNNYGGLGPRILNTLKKHWLDVSINDDIRYFAIYSIYNLGENVINEIIRKNVIEYENGKRIEKIDSLLCDII